MIVSSPVELYTVYLGWKQYDVLWEACKAFGLAWLPFLGLFYKNMTVPFETPFGHGADTSLRCVLIELLLMVIVLTFCVNPWLLLTTEDVVFKPACQPSAIESTVGDTGTTYDDIFGKSIYTDVKVPAIFALVMSWSSGFTNAVITAAMPCANSYTFLMHALEVSRLSGPVAADVMRFNNECYMPARARFDAERPDPNTYKALLDQYGGENDLTWMGSHVLRQLYYDDMTVNEPVKNFPYATYPSTYVDDAVQKGELTQPTWGYPTCEEWWSDPTYGLEQRIVDDLDSQAVTNPHYSEEPLSQRVVDLTNRVKWKMTSNLSANDIMVHTVLYNSKWNYAGYSTDGLHIDTNGDAHSIPFSNFSREILIGLGQTIKRFFKTPFERDGLSDILPIAQAVTLFMILLFMPFIMIFGGYRMSVVMGLCFMIFSLIFLNYIWYVLKFLEDSLLEAVGNPLYSLPYAQHSTIINFMTALYCGAPLFFLSLMSITGVRLGGALDRAISGAGDEADSVGKRGIVMQNTIAKTALDTAGIKL